MLNFLEALEILEVLETLEALEVLVKQPRRGDKKTAVGVVSAEART